jgi:hypothetical protein
MTTDALARRTVLCRTVIYGLPVLAAAVTLSAFHVGRLSGTYTVQSLVGIVLLANAGIAMTGSASATIFLRGGQLLRLAGAFAYGAMAFLLYMTLTIVGIRLLGA